MGLFSRRREMPEDPGINVDFGDYEIKKNKRRHASSNMSPRASHRSDEEDGAMVSWQKGPGWRDPVPDHLLRKRGFWSTLFCC